MEKTLSFSLRDEEESEDQDEVSAHDNFLEQMWSTIDGLCQPDDIPTGTVQVAYWTDGIEIVRVKQADGTWKYHEEDDGR